MELYNEIMFKYNQITHFLHQTVRTVPVSPQIFGNNSISLVKPARIVIKN